MFLMRSRPIPVRLPQTLPPLSADAGAIGLVGEPPTCGGPYLLLGNERLSQCRHCPDPTNRLATAQDRFAMDPPLSSTAVTAAGKINVA